MPIVLYFDYLLVELLDLEIQELFHFFIISKHDLLLLVLLFNLVIIVIVDIDLKRLFMALPALARNRLVFTLLYILVSHPIIVTRLLSQLHMLFIRRLISGDFCEIFDPLV